MWTLGKELSILQQARLRSRHTGEGGQMLNCAALWIRVSMMRGSMLPGAKAQPSRRGEAGLMSEARKFRVPDPRPRGGREQLLGSGIRGSLLPDLRRSLHFR